MRDWIIDAARDLLATRPSPLQSPPITLDEIAACAGISLRQLRTYYTSVAAIEADLADHGSPPAPLAGPTPRRR